MNWYINSEFAHPERKSKYRDAKEDSFINFSRPEKEEWQQTGICPNLRMYEVENSPWLKELKAKGYYTRPDWLKELQREDG